MLFPILNRISSDENGEVIPTWKADAIEGEEQQFPSIADKIKLMEEEAKKPLAMYEVPDVKSKMNAPAPAAQWMEARNLILVNSFFVKDIKEYGRSRTVSRMPDISAKSDTHKLSEFADASDTAEMPVESHTDDSIRTTAETVKILKMKDVETIQILSYLELGLFCTPVLFFLAFQIWLCILPFLKIWMFLVIVLAFTCFIIHCEHCD